ncbi:ER lumen protein-retaining receptor 3-like isoform X3 [Trichogramma pretiosum]|uniref:ER lumen protein-retaining receptor 3-like isoform X2 n=1 Tax=Trichogramma pretiosum TaxID=7493 RepID=UPI0006C96474|nr:ER lumen protein-retaining receptor 3-like isoform X2 [Trichogramma pretiosum]XP_014220520.1 ER lumen protein-retaining receptor 3-like isoform X3 [Trichogramma pretiosum]
MDIMQVLGDYILLVGMIILLAKLWLTKNCAGISGKTQLLQALAFTARFTDLTVTHVSVYHTILKIVYVLASYLTVLTIYLLFRRTRERKFDAFRMELLMLPCAVFSLFLSERFETVAVLQTFGLFLQSVAIVPQVYLVSKRKQVEAVVVSYVACLGLHLGCYISHWLYVYVKLSQVDRIAVSSGIVQLLFYCDFFARNLPILKAKRSLADVEQQQRQQRVQDTSCNANADGSSQAANSTTRDPATIGAAADATVGTDRVTSFDETAAQTAATSHHHRSYKLRLEQLAKDRGSDSDEKVEDNLPTR